MIQKGTPGGDNQGIRFIGSFTHKGRELVVFIRPKQDARPVPPGTTQNHLTPSAL